MNNFRTKCFSKKTNKTEEYIYWYFRREILLVLSAVIITGIFGGNITGMVGGNYYWYCRAAIIIGMVGGNHDW